MATSVRKMLYGGRGLYMAQCWSFVQTMSLSVFNNQSSHSLGWWHLCLPAADVSFVTSTGSAMVSMSLTSVSQIIGSDVPQSLHTISDSRSNDRHPSLRYIRYLFLTKSVLAAPVSSKACTCSAAISSYIRLCCHLWPF